MKRLFKLLLILLALLALQPSPAAIYPASGWFGSNVMNQTSADAAIGALTLTNIIYPAQRLPLTTLNKLENGKPVKVLWLGDSLVTGDYANLWKLAFQTNLIARYGANGWMGGGYLTDNGWNPSTTGVGNIAQTSDENTILFYEQLWRVTNGNTQVWSANFGDGYFSANSAALVYLRTNTLATGTLTVSIIDTNSTITTLDTINCSGAFALVGTNYTFTAGRYKLRIAASGGADVAFATPGIWNSTLPGVRYGQLGAGGLNNFVKFPSWITALNAYQPDLLLVLDANDTGITNTFTLITQLQTNRPFMDVVVLQGPPSGSAYAGPNTSLLTTARKWYQQFAQTNRNTAFFDTFKLAGGTLGYPALTNNADGIYMVQDDVHPSTSNPTLANVLGRALYQQLGFQSTSSTGNTAQTNISYLAVTNAPWFTNNETRNTYWLGDSVFRNVMSVTGSTAQVSVQRRDNSSGFVRLSAFDSAPLLLLDSTAGNKPVFYVSNRSDYYAMGIDSAYWFTANKPVTLGEFNFLKYYGSNSQFAGTTFVETISSDSRVVTSGTPSSASDSGLPGQVRFDSSYLYICTATNTWRRVAHSTW